MALTYIEFDSTPQNLLEDLRTRILGNADWTLLSNPTAVVTTTSANIAAGATSIPVASGTASAFSVGETICIDVDGLREYRTITAMTATALTVAATSFAHTSGTQLRSGHHIFKCTTTRGADMIFDLADSYPTWWNLGIAAWYQHTGTFVGGVDKIQRWLYWRASGGAANNPVHVVLSLSKEHFFVSIEGPRPNEPGVVNASYGSHKNYFFMCDMVPYHATDTTPIVVCGGQMAASVAASLASNSFQVNLSRNFQNTASWSIGKMLTLDFPTFNSTETVQVNHSAVGDGKFYVFPYVVFGDESGMRGRLSSFFFAGYTSSDTPEIPPPPTSSRITYDGQTYKLHAVSKSDGSNTLVWGQFGSAGNNAASTYFRSPVVAIPATA